MWPSPCFHSWMTEILIGMLDICLAVWREAGEGLCVLEADLEDLVFFLVKSPQRGHRPALSVRAQFEHGAPTPSCSGECASSIVLQWCLCDILNFLQWKLGKLLLVPYRYLTLHSLKTIADSLFWKTMKDWEWVYLCFFCPLMKKSSAVLAFSFFMTCFIYCLIIWVRLISYFCFSDLVTRFHSVPFLWKCFIHYKITPYFSLTFYFPSALLWRSDIQCSFCQRGFSSEWQKLSHIPSSSQTPFGKAEHVEKTDGKELVTRALAHSWWLWLAKLCSIRSLAGVQFVALRACEGFW